MTTYTVYENQRCSDPKAIVAESDNFTEQPLAYRIECRCKITLLPRRRTVERGGIGRLVSTMRGNQVPTSPNPCPDETCIILSEYITLANSKNLFSP